MSYYSKPDVVVCFRAITNMELQDILQLFINVFHKKYFFYLQRTQNLHSLGTVDDVFFYMYVHMLPTKDACPLYSEEYFRRPSNKTTAD